MGSLPVWGAVRPSSAGPWAVQQVRDIAYYRGPDADRFRHRLDLFLPRGKRDYPVVVLVHGGAWMLGDNRCCGLYSSVGEFLARQGIGAVLPNYRLSPGVEHPEHVRDVARAVAWVRAHMAEYGGSSEQIFLAGHSAGGHLVSLLATDESHLNAEGLQAADIRGVIAISGVYDIPAGSLEVTLGGSTAEAFRLDEVVPLRGGGRGWTGPGVLPGLPVRVNVFGPAFGNDARARENASPLRHVRPGLPPFLILYAEQELPTLAGMAVQFHRALRDRGCEAHLVRVENRNHNSIMFRAIEVEDPVARALVDFIRAQVDRCGSFPTELTPPSVPPAQRPLGPG
jgi:acetyl esterase/lipase